MNTISDGRDGLAIEPIAAPQAGRSWREIMAAVPGGGSMRESGPRVWIDDGPFELLAQLTEASDR